MATITQEDGTGLANATSYATEAELAAYNTERAVTLTGTYGTPSEILIKAMDYLESFKFIGTKGSDSQSLQWPRWGAVKDGYEIASDSIPLLLKEAQMEIAISIDGGTNPLVNTARETIEEKVGEISVKYSPSAHAVEYLTAAHTKLNKLTIQGVRAYRA